MEARPIVISAEGVRIRTTSRRQIVERPVRFCACGAVFVYAGGQPAKACAECRKLRDYRKYPGMTTAEMVRLRAAHIEATAKWRAGRPARERESARRDRHASKIKKYGLTPAMYAAMLAAQSGACAICAQPERVLDRRLAVDHCHETGRVRGLLCALCNTAIGKLQDSPALLRRAIRYLEGT